MKKQILFFILLLQALGLFAQQQATTKDGRKVLLYPDGTWAYIQQKTDGQLEIPAIKATDSVIKHLAYSLVFDKSFKQAKWVAYELTAAETNKIAQRSDKFIPDPVLPQSTNHAADYAGSGYDRGHLAPAADMSWSYETMKESFYYSNMSPQVPGFNRGIWKKLEEQVRLWAKDNEAIYVVTGPVLTGVLARLGESKIAIPQYYYKVILDYKSPSVKGIGFILPNASSSLPLQNYAVSIDSVQKATGIDFYPLLADKEEREIEASVCIPCWNWDKGIKASSPQPNPSKKESTTEIKKEVSVQCSGITKAGNRCKRMTYNSSGRCYQH